MTTGGQESNHAYGCLRLSQTVCDDHIFNLESNENDAASIMASDTGRIANPTWTLLEQVPQIQLTDARSTFRDSLSVRCSYQFHIQPKPNGRVSAINLFLWRVAPRRRIRCQKFNLVSGQVAPACNVSGPLTHFPRT